MSNSEHGLHNDTWKLIQPELLSPSELVHILKERQITVEESDTSNKNKLVEIFKRVATPLPQRNRFLSSSASQSARNSNGTFITNTFNCNTKTASFASSKSTTVQNHKSPSVVNSGTKILKLKRSSEALQPERGSSTQNGSDEPAPKKREKITWP